MNNITNNNNKDLVCINCKQTQPNINNIKNTSNFLCCDACRIEHCKTKSVLSVDINKYSDACSINVEVPAYDFIEECLL